MGRPTNRRTTRGVRSTPRSSGGTGTGGGSSSGSGLLTSNNNNYSNTTSNSTTNNNKNSIGGGSNANDNYTVGGGTNYSRLSTGSGNAYTNYNPYSFSNSNISSIRRGPVEKWIEIDKTILGSGSSSVGKGFKVPVYVRVSSLTEEQYNAAIQRRKKRDELFYNKFKKLEPLEEELNEKEQEEIWQRYCETNKKNNSDANNDTTKIDKDIVNSNEACNNNRNSADHDSAVNSMITNEKTYVPQNNNINDVQAAESEKIMISETTKVVTSLDESQVQLPTSNAGATAVPQQHDGNAHKIDDEGKKPEPETMHEVHSSMTTEIDINIHQNNEPPSFVDESTSTENVQQAETVAGITAIVREQSNQEGENDKEIAPVFAMEVSQDINGGGNVLIDPMVSPSNVEKLEDVVELPKRDVVVDISDDLTQHQEQLTEEGVDNTAKIVHGAADFGSDNSNNIDPSETATIQHHHQQETNGKDDDAHDDCNDVDDDSNKLLPPKKRFKPSNYS